MTLGLTLVIVLSVIVIVLALAVYHLATRVSGLETAVDGGLRTPERPLSGDEYAARFATATRRAALAREFGDGVAIFLDGATGRSGELLDIVANLSTGRGVTLVFAGPAPAPRWPADVTVRANMGEYFEPAGIVATPFGMTISDRRIVDARLLGSDAALAELLGERPAGTVETTPLEVD